MFRMLGCMTVCGALASCSALPIGTKPQPTVTVTATTGDVAAPATTTAKPVTAGEDGWPTNIKGLSTDFVTDYYDMDISQHEAVFITMGEQLVSSSMQFAHWNISAVVSVTEVDFRPSTAPDGAGKDVLIRWQVRIVDPGDTVGDNFDYFFGSQSFAPNGLSSLQAQRIRSSECPYAPKTLIQKGQTYERCAVWTVAKPFTAVNFTTHNNEPLAYFKFAGEIEDITLLKR